MNVQDMIRRHEGLRLKPYRCSTNHLTIGFGHLIHEWDTAPEIITIDQANDWFEEDLAEATEGAKLLVANWDELGEVRQAVLIDMCFNLGKFGLSKFHNMRAAIAEKDWNMAALAMLNSRWAIQVKGRADELSEMMRTGKWSQEDAHAQP